MALASGARLGPYEIVRQLGAGGMGVVYQARDPRLGRQVAIKVLTPAFASDPVRVRRFEQESRAVAMLSHPNVVTVHDVGTDAATPYLVTELLDGETLRTRILGGALPAAKVVDIAAQIARGLAAAHTRGIVHRDLKPENVFVDRSGRVKVLDFGVAKHVESGATGSANDTTGTLLTGEGEVVGTVEYMSPEQVTGRAVDQRSDLFSLGVIVHEMLTGRQTFAGRSTTETMAAILRDEPADLTGLAPAPLAAVARRCVAKDPDERYQSAGDLAFHLEALLGPPLLEGRAAQRRRWLAPIAAAAAVASVAGLGASWWTARPSLPATYERLTFRSGFVLNARFAPDGETVLYNAIWDGARNELYSMRSGSPESRVLGHPDADLMAVSRSGDLAVVLNPSRRGGPTRGTLARVGLASTVPRLLLEDVVAADWSPSGELAVVRIVGQAYRVEYPMGTLLYETQSQVAAARLSPDGGRLALFEGSAVVVLDRRGARTLLSDGWSIANTLAWHPRGDELWFSATALAPTILTASIYAVSMDGRVRRVAEVPDGISVEDIAPDGRVLAVTNAGTKGVRLHRGERDVEQDLTWFDWGLAADLSPDLKTLLFSEGGRAAGQRRVTYIRGTDGTPAVRLGEGTAQAYSPDGTRVLVIRTIDGVSRVISVPTGPGDERVLTSNGLASRRASWIGDGRRVVVVGNEPNQPARSYVVGAEGGTPQPVTPPGVVGAVTSRDGLWLLAARPGEPHAAYPVAGGEPRAIPNLTSADEPVAWNRDGTAIYVRRDFQPENPDVIDVFTVAVTDGRRALWKRIRPVDGIRLPDLLPIAIGRDDASYAYTYWRSSMALYLVAGLR